MSKRYWICVIGPVAKEELPEGADFPMREVVRDAFEALIGRTDESCWSGWGLDEQHVQDVMAAWQLSGAEEVNHDHRP